MKKDIIKLGIFLIPCILCGFLMFANNFTETKFQDIEPAVVPINVTGDISCIIECATEYTLSSVTQGMSLLEDEFILHGINYREGYVDFVFDFESEFIVKDFKICFDFLDLNKSVIKTLETSADGVYSKTFNSITCNVPDGAASIRIKCISFNSYNKEDLVYADLGNLCELGEEHPFEGCLLKVSRKNNAFIRLEYKKKSDYSKAVLMIHDPDGRILNSYILDKDRYKCDVNTDFGSKSYSVCFIK